MILRGSIITKAAVSKKEKGAFVGRLSLRMDLTDDLIKQMGWDCLIDGEGKLTNGWDTLPLSGELALVSATFRSNRRDGTKCEVKASELQGFAAHRIKAKDGDSTLVYLSATMLSSDEEFEVRVGQYWRSIGDGKSQLTIKEAQVSMFPQEGEADEEGDGDDE